jgi:hypothetical protein
MLFSPHHREQVAMLSRRRFVNGIAATGALAGIGLARMPASAATLPGNPGVLSGSSSI